MDALLGDLLCSREEDTLADTPLASSWSSAGGAGSSAADGLTPAFERLLDFLYDPDSLYIISLQEDPPTLALQPAPLVRLFKLYAPDVAAPLNHIRQAIFFDACSLASIPCVIIARREARRR